MLDIVDPDRRVTSRLHFFSRTPLGQFRRMHRGGVGADSRYSTLALAPSRLQPFKFSESDERHSCFNSSAKGTAHLPAVWIGIAHRTESLPELFACSGPAHSSLAAAVRRNARSEERRVGKECRSRWAPNR